MRGIFRPPKVIWLLAHVVVFLVGMFVAYAPWVSGLLGESIAAGVGASLIAAGVAGYILYLYVSLSEDDRQLYSVLVTAGLYRIFPARSVVIKKEYEQRIQDAKRIDIIGFGLSTFRQDYGDVFVDWKKKRVRILVIDPEFPNSEVSFASQRDQEERNDHGQIAKEVLQFLKTAEPALKDDVFEVKLMRALPSINYFRVDEEIFWGPYLVGGPSRNTPTLLVKGGYLFDVLSKHFENIWSGADLSSKYEK